MVSPPKPWESQPTSAAVPTTATTSSNAPSLPARPDSLNSIASRTAANYSTPFSQSSAYSSPYGYAGSSYGGGMYNRFGGGYGGYGGYGGLGGMYGSSMYNSPYGMGGMYGGQPGMFDPNAQDQSLTQAYTQSTQVTFQMIHNIVEAFGGFAEMLRSTFAATHSSFFAMVSVAEQFGNLKETLGSVLGIFTLMRWIRSALAKLTGRPPPASSTELTPAKFAAFSGSPAADGVAAQSRPSRRPFIFFVVAVFGLPFLMSKLIRALAANQESEQQRQLMNSPYSGTDHVQPLDPSKLEFCKVLYDYTPQPQPGQQHQEGIDLEVKKGDLVAVLAKTDPNGQPSEWWRCRARNGKMGYLPSPYLEIFKRKLQPQIAATSDTGSPEGSRINTMTSTNSMKLTEREKAEVKRIPGPKSGITGVEAFQKSAFYS